MMKGLIDATKTPTVIIGDIHGDIAPLIRILSTIPCGTQNSATTNTDAGSDGNNVVPIITFPDAILQNVGKCTLQVLDNNGAAPFDSLLLQDMVWNGQNTQIVLLGDVLDSVRRTKASLDRNADSYDMFGLDHCGTSQSLSILLETIIAIHRLALRDGGGVTITLGNHDLENMRLVETGPTTYCSKYAPLYNEWKGNEWKGNEWNADIVSPTLQPPVLTVNNIGPHFHSPIGHDMSNKSAITIETSDNVSDYDDIYDIIQEQPPSKRHHTPTPTTTSLVINLPHTNVPNRIINTCTLDMTGFSPEHGNIIRRFFSIVPTIGVGCVYDTSGCAGLAHGWVPNGMHKAFGLVEPSQYMPSRLRIPRTLSLSYLSMQIPSHESQRLSSTLTSHNTSTIINTNETRQRAHYVMKSIQPINDIIHYAIQPLTTITKTAIGECDCQYNNYSDFDIHQVDIDNKCRDNEYLYTTRFGPNSCQCHDNDSVIDQHKKQLAIEAQKRIYNAKQYSPISCRLTLPSTTHLSSPNMPKSDPLPTLAINCPLGNKNAIKGDCLSIFTGLNVVYKGHDIALSHNHVVGDDGSKTFFGDVAMSRAFGNVPKLNAPTKKTVISSLSSTSSVQHDNTRPYMAYLIGPNASWGSVIAPVVFKCSRFKF